MGPTVETGTATLDETEAEIGTTTRVTIGEMMAAANAVKRTSSRGTMEPQAGAAIERGITLTPGAAQKC